MSPRPRKRDGYHHGDLQRVILDAALAWIEKDGVGEVSLRELARKAGVSHGAPYHHFKDRAGLFAAIAVEGFDLLTAQMRAAVAKAKTPTTKFEASGRAYVAFALKSKGHFRVMFRSELNEPSAHPAVDQASQRAFAVLFELVVACQAQGLAPGLDPLALTLMGWSTAHGLSMLLVDGPLGRAGKMEGLDDPAAQVAHALSALLAGSSG